MMQENKATIRDLGSRNGTYVNGIKINGKKNINIGDKITIGAVSGYLKQNQ